MALDYGQRFNHPFKVDRVQVTTRAGYNDSGVYSKEVTTTTEIKGDFQPGPMEVSEFTGLGTRLEEGEAIFYTTTVLAVNDILHIYHDKNNTSFTKYRVIGVLERYDWMAAQTGETARIGFKLKREEN